MESDEGAFKPKGLKFTGKSQTYHTADYHHHRRRCCFNRRRRHRHRFHSHATQIDCWVSFVRCCFSGRRDALAVKSSSFYQTLRLEMLR